MQKYDGIIEKNNSIYLIAFSQDTKMKFVIDMVLWMGCWGVV
jgi:hypothetical protein